MAAHHAGHRRRLASPRAPVGPPDDSWCHVSTIGFVANKYLVQFSVPTLSGENLLVAHMEGEESMSGLYRFRLRLHSENPSLAFASIVGKDGVVSIGMPDGSKQFMHGIVGRCQQAGTTVRFTTYLADLYPRLWLLTKTQDCRIFQNKSVPDIVKQVLNEHGITDIDDAL